MTAEPLVTPTAPVTTPVEVIAATEGALLVQTPPAVASVSDMLEPAHTCDAGPVIGDGSGLTVTGILTAQPTPIEYVTENIPAVTPVTIPFAEPMVAVSGALLVQMPPPASVSVIEPPTHT
jgi:hypothetical protein